MIVVPETAVEIVRMFIPIQVVGLNSLIGKGRRFRKPKKDGKGYTYVQSNKAYQNYRDSCKELLEQYVGFAPPDHKKDQYHICFVTSSRKKGLDRDNAIGGCKPIFDGLTELGWIKDDNDKYFFCDYFQETGMNDVYHGIILELLQCQGFLRKRHCKQDFRDLAGIKKTIQGDPSADFFSEY